MKPKSQMQEQQIYEQFRKYCGYKKAIKYKVCSENGIKYKVCTIIRHTADELQL